MNSRSFFDSILKARDSSSPLGIYSICSAHPLVLEASFENAAEKDLPVLVEATANQVNQFGGYTGMKPADFKSLVFDIARRCGLPQERIILGGDHLGPFVWRDRPAAEAMSLSEDLVRSYVEAGFTKIHLDTSMPLGDDPHDQRITDELIAARGARLCMVSEATYESRKLTEPSMEAPLYVIGSEVPTPGGSQTDLEMEVTSPHAFLASYSAFESAFRQNGLLPVLNRVIAFVIQPGVEFDDTSVFDYDSAAAHDICSCLKVIEPPMIFEGHSTDYQTKEALRLMVRDGIAILKVGPALTFALREGLFALEKIEEEMLPLMASDFQPSLFSESLERAMLTDDRHWAAYYTGTGAEQRLARRFSYSDRARYYLQLPDVSAAIDRLLSNLSALVIPETLLRQYLPGSYHRLRFGQVGHSARELLKDHIKQTLADYDYAVGCPRS